MSGSRKHKQRRRKPLPGQDSPAGGPGPEGTAGDEDEAGRGSLESWFESRRHVLRFLLVYGLFLAVFNAVFYLWLSEGDIFDAYMGLNAKCSAFVLTVFGDDATASGMLLVSPRYSLDIKRGCDAIQASAFFVFAVLLAPVSVSRMGRVVPAIVGTLFLLAMNLFRIVSLYYTGVHYPSAFEMMHVDVWQGVFILMPVILWVIWSAWAMGRGSQDAQTPA